MKKDRSVGWRQMVFETLGSIGSLAAATMFGILFSRAGFPETNVVLLYILAVLVTSCMTRGYVFGILVSVGATFTFNYFFTDPYLTFNVNDPSYMITFAIMTITALISSTLTSRVKENAQKAKERERDTNALYQFTSRMTEAKEEERVARIAVDTISQLMGCQAACLCFDVTGEPQPVFVQMSGEKGIVSRKTEHAERIRRKMELLRGDFEKGEEFFDWPIYGTKQIQGVIRIPSLAASAFTEPQRHFLHSLIDCTALALERIHSMQQQMISRQKMEQERYRGNLLRAISHDLRTPLSGIMGTSEMIMDMSEKTDPRYKLAEGIFKDSHWLHSLVENILSLTRIQEGRLEIKKEMEAVEEIVGGAVAQLESRAPEYEISVTVPDEVLMIPMDGKLMMQVLINLLDNAVKHTNPGEEISISVKKDIQNNRAIFCVADRGEGISTRDLPHIFQTFYTSVLKTADAKKGIGLGLPICETIIKAHGGEIEARNRTDGPGAEFIFHIPLDGKITGKKEENG